VTVGIVDNLEAVQIEHHYCEQFLRTGGTKILLKPLLEEATVGQSGQWVVPRELKGFSLGGNAPGDFPGEVFVATISINHQRDAQHEYDEDRASTSQSA
jgi:hypothetical protein